MSCSKLASWHNSKPFRFFVGPDKHEFSIHSALVAQQSPALDALVNNGMKESHENGVFLPDFDVETFSCFFEFVYNGDFRSPLCIEFSEEHLCKNRKTHFDAPTPFEWWDAGIETWERFETLSMYAYDGKQLYDTQLQSRDEVPSFMFLAKVYVFADYYRIDKLMKLSLHKLHQLMISHPGSLDIIELAQFRLNGGCPERLGRLVLVYLAFHLYHVSYIDGYKDLAEKNPSFMVEVMDLFMLLIEGEGLVEEK